MNEKITQIVAKINEDLPVHSMWDGFWIYSFKRKTLIVSCSFDSIYYRDYDLIFKQVRFFNIPENWRDTNVPSKSLLRLANEDEFRTEHPDFEVQDSFIFAIDLSFNNNSHTFYILAKHIYLIKCEAPNNDSGSYYTEPIQNEFFPSKRNRVTTKTNN